MPIILPLIIGIARIAASALVFVAVDTLVSKLMADDDDALLDELMGGAAASAAFKGTDLAAVKLAVKKIPPLPAASTAAGAAEYLAALEANKAGYAALNARLGGYAPAVIKLLQTLNQTLPKLAKFSIKKATIVTAGITALFWSPQLISNILDHGVFNPEQANDIFDAWGLPEKFRWPTKVGGLGGGDGDSGGGGGGLTAGSGPRTIIRMVEEKKPMQFLGTLFSAKLGKLEHFDRKLDDEITDMADLEADVKLNLNKWLKTLPGRMGYSIVIRKDPVDETGGQQSGIWATATLHILQLSGKIMPIDTILLGPVSPAVRLELARSTKTIETQIDGIISAQEIREIDIPSGVVDIFSPTGERVFQSGKTPAPVETKSETVPPPAKNNFGYAYREGAKPGDAGQQMFSAEQKSQYIGYGFDIRPEPIFPGTSASSPTSQLSASGTLRQGDKGEAVKELQTLLNNWGAELVTDGDFGPLTEAEVRNFQSKNQLKIDGLVGPETKKMLFLRGR